MNYEAARAYGALPIADEALDIPEKKPENMAQWRQKMPAVQGWYWATAPGLWPQCIELVYNKGKLIVSDRHTRGSESQVWTYFLGPIPYPDNPNAFMGKEGYVNDGKRVPRRHAKHH